MENVLDMMTTEENALRDNLYRQTKSLLDNDRRRKRTRYTIFMSTAMIALLLSFWWWGKSDADVLPNFAELVTQQTPPILTKTLGGAPKVALKLQAVDRAYANGDYTRVVELSRSILAQNDSLDNGNGGLLLTCGYALLQVDSTAAAEEIFERISKESEYKQSANYFAALFGLKDENRRPASLAVLCQIANNGYHNHVNEAAELLSHLPANTCKEK